MAGPRCVSGRQLRLIMQGVEPVMARALSLRGFKTPTPIQRASIPHSLSTPSRDVLGMARTGSGKTLAYLIPLLQRLRSRRSVASGARALVICPNRELASQILRVGKDLARGGTTKDSTAEDDRLKWALIIGGDGMDKQFEILTSSPDM